ncbi:MAG: hypothetical protein ACJA2S_001705, partial [Cyclobacteriaceae bacterium]
MLQNKIGHFCPSPDMVQSYPLTGSLHSIPQLPFFSLN